MPETAPIAVASWDFGPDRRPLGVTRSGVFDFLREAGVDEDCLERSVVAVDELVTNAVDHVGRPCELWVSVRRRWVRISVHDPVPIDFSARWVTSSHGTGLRLVAQVSAQLFLQPAYRGKYVVALMARRLRGEADRPAPALRLPF